MIKYYKELENPNDFTLPLLDDTFRNYKKLYDFHIPISFYDKHQLLFEAIKQIDFFIKCGNIEKRQKEIDCLYNQGTIDNEAYWNYCDTLAGFKNFQYEQLPDIEQLILTNQNGKIGIKNG